MTTNENPTDGIPTGFRFPSILRLHHRLDFERAFNNGRQAADAHLIVYAFANSLAYSRLGIVAARRLGNAPRRNRMKRLLREAFRLRRHELPPGIDLVCILKSVERPTREQYENSLIKLAARAQRKSANR